LNSLNFEWQDEAECARREARAQEQHEVIWMTWYQELRDYSSAHNNHVTIREDDDNPQVAELAKWVKSLC
jgi:hypothetical protein